MPVSQVSESVGPLLAQLGFKKRAGDIFTIELADDALGWLGMNKATQGRPAGEVEVNPVVGVRHQGVEQLVAELRGEKFHSYLPPTVSSPLGYLMPDARYKGWLFTPAEVDAVAADMAAAIAAHAVPFMQSCASLGEICRRLEQGRGLEHQALYRLPVARFLAGDAAQAASLLESSMAKMRERTDAAAAEFKQFATAFNERLTSVF